jgi:pyridoxamine 5'-phosphate oxidase
MQNLADLRKEYTRASLDEGTVSADPIQQFQQWFREAYDAELPEPTAMNLATVTPQNTPTSRVVLLKGIENNRFLFFTNYQSDKGKELEVNPACALTFFWAELERQVRIEGIATRLDEQKSLEYFQSRPRGSQVGAWSSPQSAVIKDRHILEERVEQMEKKFQGQDALPKPQQWGGYEVEPLLFEFWQGRPSRLHDRIEYVKVDGVWQIHRLAP